MAINVADNFSYKGGKPLDNRTKYSTIESMVATPAADLYDGCLAYVTSTKKNYQYDSTNTVDENLGKWRELQTGGTGEGIPTGGTTGQILAKKTNADYDVEWANSVDTNAFHTDDITSDIVDDVSYFPYMYTAGQSFYKYRMSWGNIKSKLKTFFDQYYSGGGTGGGVTIDATLIAANWNSTTKQQTITFTGYTSSMGGVIGMPTSATSTQKTAYENAKINVVSVSGTSFTFECTTIPSVDLPVTLYAGGGSGGTTDYDDLTNKPQIAGTTLTGNTSLATLGLTSSVETQFSGSSTKSYVTRGEKYDWNSGNTVYGTCSVSASTVAKTVTIVRGIFNFDAGSRIAVKFSYANTISTPTLQVNSLVKNIKCIDESGNTYTPSIWWNANDIVEFVYDGTQFLMQPTMQMLFAGQSTRIPREQIYSTAEKVVGCWTDGRPVYQKVITGTTNSSSDTKYFSIGATINQIISCEIMLTDTSGNFIPAKGLNVVNSTLGSSSVEGIRVIATNNNVSTNKNSLIVRTTVQTWQGVSFFAIVQYTKTTDSANSFNYGDPNDYSTTEKIIGTWIDGKPLYQKTLSDTLPNCTTDGTEATKLISMGVTAKLITGLKLIAVRSNGTEVVTGNYYVLDASGKYIKVSGNNSSSSNPNTIGLALNKANWANSPCYVTVQYTKS